MKILSLLNLSKEARKSTTIARKARTMKRNQEALIDKLEGERDALEDRKDKLLDFSSKELAKDWNEDFQNVLVKIDIAEAKIKTANKTLLEYFTDVVEAE